MWHCQIKWSLVWGLQISSYDISKYCNLCKCTFFCKKDFFNWWHFPDKFPWSVMINSILWLKNIDYHASKMKQFIKVYYERYCQTCNCLKKTWGIESSFLVQNIIKYNHINMEQYDNLQIYTKPIKYSNICHSISNWFLFSK